MKLFIGLGNPGKEHENNRHNAGFMFLDFIAGTFNTESNFKNEKKFEADMFEVVIDAEKILFVKPQTYMNAIGRTVKKLADFYKIDPDNIIVAHDDLDLELGSFKIQKGRGPKIHNGILSIEEHLGSSDFTRIRIGIDNRDPENRFQGKDYVLSSFTHEEELKLNDIFNKIIKNLQSTFRLGNILTE